MIDQVVFISTGYLGGANKFLEENLNYIKIRKYLLDNNPKKNFVLKKKKLTKLKINPLTQYNYLKSFFNKKIINKNKSRNTIVLMTNFAIIVKNIFIFVKLKNSGAKISIALHSGIFKNRLIVNLSVFLFSIISIFLIDKIIFGSGSSKKWWLSRFPWMSIVSNKIIYNGIDLTKKKKNKINKKKIRVSFVGRLSPENNIKLFCEIAKFNKKKNICFKVFGSGENEDIVKEYKNFIKFYGWRNQDYIYKNTDIVIITSAINNFPYVALEAKNYGIPILSCSKGDISKIISNGKDGIIKITNNVKILSNCLYKIKKNYNFYSNNAYKNIKKFDSNISKEKIWKFLLNENNHSR